MHEPSPASTYGETAAGDSIPATPQADGDHGKCLFLFLSLLLLSSAIIRHSLPASGEDRFAVAEIVG